MIFEDGANVKFDTKKYVRNHLPLLREVYGDSVERIELRVVADAEDEIRALVSTVGGLFGVRAATTFWIRDVAAFSQASRAMKFPSLPLNLRRDRRQ